MKTTVPLCEQRLCAGLLRFFDIVNGFLIDAVAHRVKKMSAVMAIRIGARMRHLQMLNLAEINRPHHWRRPGWAIDVRQLVTRIF
jgi:hypothetical protein